MWSKPEISAGAPLTVQWDSHAPQILRVQYWVRATGRFAERAGGKSENPSERQTNKKSRTFSGHRACRSEQHRADKQQTSRRLHLPWRASTLVHNPAGGVCFQCGAPKWLRDFLISIFCLFIFSFFPEKVYWHPCNSPCVFSICATSSLEFGACCQ